MIEYKTKDGTYTPPVICTNCGHVSMSSWGIAMGSNSTVTMSGNRETCQKCGKLANIVDGKYEILSGENGLVANIHGMPREQLETLLEFLLSQPTAAEIDKQIEKSTDTKTAHVLHEVRKNAGVISMVIQLVKLYLDIQS